MWGWFDTLPGYIRELLGVRVWHPTPLASHGPARPDGTVRASPGKLALQAHRTPTHAHGTSSTARCCFCPRERLSVERRATAWRWPGARGPPTQSRRRECNQQGEGAIPPPPQAGGVLAESL